MKRKTIGTGFGNTTGNSLRFDAAAEKVRTLTKKPTDEELLSLYGLFKQGSVGDNETSK
ncbi:Acyl-CoA-binding domain-containing protein 2 [Polyplax serrata]|uniref:Acyl-CoA-binding domain-containing protein 2 n=1 Tax=Polyplax serrata TaxID=468196 RepID=A0AAN8P0G8_POLSC